MGTRNQRELLERNLIQSFFFIFYFDIAIYTFLGMKKNKDLKNSNAKNNANNDSAWKIRRENRIIKIIVASTELCDSKEKNITSRCFTTLNMATWTLFVKKSWEHYENGNHVKVIILPKRFSTKFFEISRVYSKHHNKTMCWLLEKFILSYSRFWPWESAGFHSRSYGEQWIQNWRRCY